MGDERCPDPLRSWCARHVDEQVILVRRDNGEKQAVQVQELLNIIPKMLAKIQSSLLQQAKDFQNANTNSVIIM
ncbi:MAG: hypothetical protein CM1200mP10_19120 [Candidatus Neomarinimicrobiota bacterium]|nr:MAG: hypothetical protein CM1200mP10_19120 [Candidatus Neomarinimicrobiota bacterium]